MAILKESNLIDNKLLKNQSYCESLFSDPRRVKISKTYNASSFSNKLIVGQNRHVPCGIPEQATYSKQANSKGIVGRNKKSQSED